VLVLGLVLGLPHGWGAGGLQQLLLGRLSLQQGLVHGHQLQVVPRRWAKGVLQQLQLGACAW
jgi:hypothetical protein